MDGRQVAILVPTTVLAQQHYDTFQQRLAAYPVTVEMLSRFRSQREQNEILRKLLLGQVDIVIGTHRLISPDVEFKDLGLVIIDEEQRFGVTHKEHLKKLRTEVDVLTLTATPIPARSTWPSPCVISNLATPPEERLPIITHVGPYAPRLVRQAILRELERGGQIFFVHNRVQTIHAMAAHLRGLAPEARIAIGHGQMPEQELSDVMHQFTNGDVDILLSTTIVESGLDIPNANTLIVDRADTFGLAQLYQLRGRVGRGAMRAYAYFFRHRRKPPTMDGQERLEVIAENTQLGARLLHRHARPRRSAARVSCWACARAAILPPVGFHFTRACWPRRSNASARQRRPSARKDKDERNTCHRDQPAFGHPSFADASESGLKGARHG
jgi:transcription-repair coupling factor (superfamily II helicase)